LKDIEISFWDQTIVLRCPQSVAAEFEFVFRGSLGRRGVPTREIVVEELADGRFSMADGEQEPVVDLHRRDLAVFVMDAVVRGLVTDVKSAVALHTGAVAWNDAAVLIAGASGSGKSSMTAWFTAQGFRYLTDEVAILSEKERQISGFPRALVLKPGARERVAEFPDFQGAPSVASGDHILIRPKGTLAPLDAPVSAGLIIFPCFSSGSELRIHAVTAADATVRLVGCNLNARNLPDGGFRAISDLARAVPSVSVTYGAFEQLDGIVDVLARFLLESPLDVADKRRFLSAYPRERMLHAVAERKKTYPIPAPTPRREAKKLTIGMATYDDYDGVYFSLQALRLYHPEIAEDVDFLVVDNHPDGASAEVLKKLEAYIPNYRYVPFSAHSGTTVKGVVFEEAGGDHVLCMDSHVFVVPGALARLIRHFASDPGTKDLLQGPLIYDDLASVATHFQPRWNKGMYGDWATDERGKDSDGPAFDIPMQGMGLFACGRRVWPGFNPLFRGFGGEEGYIHEKFRRRGGRTLCLPFLRWMHRFQRPLGTPYENRWEDRIRNYVIGFRELGWPTAELETHFRGYVGTRTVNDILDGLRTEGLAA
jgi:hypothetical protein